MHATRAVALALAFACTLPAGPQVSPSEARHYDAESQSGSNGREDRFARRDRLDREENERRAAEIRRLAAETTKRPAVSWATVARAWEVAKQAPSFLLSAAKYTGLALLCAFALGFLIIAAHSLRDRRWGHALFVVALSAACAAVPIWWWLAPAKPESVAVQTSPLPSR